MTMAQREQHVNNAETALAEPLDSSETAIDLDDGSVFPSVGNFRVMVDDEIMVCTSRSTNTITVVRGQDGTAAAAHDDLSPIRMIYSAQGINRLMQDHDPLWGYSSRPALHGVYDDAGTDRLTATDFTWENQGGASRNDNGDSITLRLPTDASNNFRGMTLTPGGNFTYVGAFRCLVGGDSSYYSSCSLGLRESGTSKIVALHYGGSSFLRSRFSLGKWTSSSALSGGVFQFDRSTLHLPGPIWFKCEYDGTNIKLYGGNDGWNWVQFLSEAKATFFTTAPDQIIWGGSNLQNSSTNATEMIVSLDHWHKE